MIRFRYPGAGAENAYSGSLAPVTSRVSRVLGARTNGPADAPLFGRRIYHAARRVWSLRWPALSHEEARSLVTQWEDASRGAAAVTYTPDDQETPVVVLPIAAPEVAYLSAMTASVALVVEEQR